MNNKIKLIILGLFISIVSYAQSGSGYLGKKFAIGYDNNIGIKFFGMRMHNNLSLDYFASNRINIKISGLYDNFSFPNNYQFNYIYDNNNYSSINLFDYTKMQNQAIGFGFAMYFYPSNFVGPVGSYHKLEFQYLHFSTDTKFNGTFPKIYGTLDEPEKYTAYAQYLSYGFGKRYVFYDAILLTLGAEVGINVHKINGFLFSSNVNYEFEQSQDLNLIYDTMINYYYNNTMFLRANIGIAYLF